VRRLDLQGSEAARWHVYADGLHLVACLHSLPRDEAQAGSLTPQGADTLRDWLRSAFADVVMATETVAADQADA
jgi:hypothetical protein